MKLILLFSITLASVSTVTACEPIEQEVIFLKGSGTLGAIMIPRLAEAYQETHPSIRFDIEIEGSSSAFPALRDGTATIGMSSRPATEKEKALFDGELKEIPVAADMIAIIVNSANPIHSLKREQVRDIYTGEVTNWMEVGGEDLTISVYSRNTSSSTYKSFQEMAMEKKPYGADVQPLASGESPVREVSLNPGGVAYVGLAYTKAKGVKIIAIDGVFPTLETVDDFPIRRYLYFYTVGKPSGEDAKFIHWIRTSKEAAEIIAQVGFIPYPLLADRNH